MNDEKYILMIGIKIKNNAKGEWGDRKKLINLVTYKNISGFY